MNVDISHWPTLIKGLVLRGGEDFNYNYLGLDHEDTKNASLSLPLAIYTARRG